MNSKCVKCKIDLSDMNKCDCDNPCLCEDKIKCECPEESGHCKACCTTKEKKSF